jgi:hypothetical protein
VEVYPESIRNYLEEELIFLHPESSWNRENKARLKASGTGRGGL